MRAAAPFMLALVCVFAATAHGRTLLKKEHTKPYIIVPENQPIVSVETSAGGKKYDYLKIAKWIPEKIVEKDEGDDKKKGHDDKDKPVSYRLAKYEGEGLSIGKKPEVTITFNETNSYGNVISKVDTVATDKYGKPKFSKAKAYAANSQKNSVPIEYDGDNKTKEYLKVDSEAKTGVRMFNKKAPSSVTAVATTAAIPNVTEPANSKAIQNSAFDTNEPSKYVKDPEEAVKTLQHIKGGVGIYDKDGNLIKKIKDESD